uniref:Uncharacterized protein n=1 Tax=Glossina brevipalpis TaxID=37001 RepID=A0A1A9WEN9_9MUSC
MNEFKYIGQERQIIKTRALSHLSNFLLVTNRRPGVKQGLKTITVKDIVTLLDSESFPLKFVTSLTKRNIRFKYLSENMSENYISRDDLLKTPAFLPPLYCSYATFAPHAHAANHLHYLATYNVYNCNRTTLQKVCNTTATTTATTLVVYIIYDCIECKTVISRRAATTITYKTNNDDDDKNCTDCCPVFLFIIDMFSVAVVAAVPIVVITRRKR